MTHEFVALIFSAAQKKPMAKKTRARVRIVGNYQLLKRIGIGAMSQVFKARTVSTGEIVAVKVAARDVLDDPNLRKRFEQEYTAVYHLNHPNLVKMLDYSEHKGVPYLVMEYLDGHSLADHIEKHKRLSEHEALSILLPIADVLTYLHGKQLIHRDIKPANILITTDGRVKLADLGIIKDLDASTQLTDVNMALGSLQFASPEQCENASSVNFRSDIYSLAATFYMAFTGEFPFGKGTASGMLMRKFSNQFIAPIQKVPHLSPAIDAALRVALHADPDQRPASVAEFVEYMTGWKKYPDDVVLPGKAAATPTPAAHVEPVELPIDERRACKRYELHLSGSCRAPINPDAQAWASAIVDISQTGIGLKLNRRFEVGTILEIMFSARADDEATTHLARVRWNKPAAGKGWSHGCVFVSPLSNEDLQLLFDRAGRKDR